MDSERMSEEAENVLVSMGLQTEGGSPVLVEFITMEKDEYEDVFPASRLPDGVELWLGGGSYEDENGADVTVYASGASDGAVIGLVVMFENGSRLDWWRTDTEESNVEVLYVSETND